MPRRRVPASVRLSNGEVLRGDVYVAMRRADGGRERVADRLNDAEERFFPLAVEGRHLLVRKAAVIAVHVDDPEEAPPGVRDDDDSVLLRWTLADGTWIEGRLPLDGLGPGPRALDYLNHLEAVFFPILGDGVTVVHRNHVVAVEERSVPGSGGRTRPA